MIFRTWPEEKVKRIRSAVRRRIEQIAEVLAASTAPMSLREIHYSMVKAELYANTKQNYHQLSAWSTKGREAGLLDWGKIVDDTREKIETPWWDSIDKAVQARIDNYRGDRWRTCPRHVELWVEKRTMVRTVEDIADEYAIPLIYGAGFNSTSAIWDAITRLVQYKGKQIRIIYCGDFDPSGLYMHEDIEERLGAFGQDLDLQVSRLLLTLGQVDELRLPRAFEVKAKKPSGEVYDKLRADPRWKRMKEKYGEVFQVEVEAMDRETIRGLVRAAIEPLLPDDYEEAIRREARHQRAMRKRIGLKGGAA